MSKVNKSNISIFILILLSTLPLLMSNKAIIENSHLIYLSLFIVGFIACNRNNTLSHFVTPNALIFFYFILNFLLGSWGFSKEYILVVDNLYDFYDWKYRSITTSLSMLCPSIFLIVDILHHKKYEVISLNITWLNHSGFFLAGALFLAPFFFFPLNLDFVGAQGDLAILPKGIAAIAIIFYLSKLNKIKRYMGYAILIIFFTTFSVDEKREAIFLIFPIIWLEANRYRTKLTPSVIFSGTAVIAILTTLILSMSIIRGYGNFGDVSSIYEAILFVPQYIDSDFFISAFLVNIEATYLYFHALNSIDMLLSDLDLLAYGSTLIKPLFIIFPREIFPLKPDSILELYTSAYDPGGRAIGGSWTIGLFSEFIWNFHILGIFLVLLVAKLLCKLNLLMLGSASYINPAKIIMYLFIFLHLFTWVRGSGLDQYFIYLMIGLISVAPIYFIHVLFKPYFKRMH